jgi:hypothetical protein
MDRDSPAPLPLESVVHAICAFPLSPGQNTETLREWLSRQRFGPYLKQIGVQQLAACLAGHARYVDAWYAWADARRLRHGPYLFRFGEGGWVGLYDSSGVAFESMKFPDPVRACAEFIALELSEGD